MKSTHTQSRTEFEIKALQHGQQQIRPSCFVCDDAANDKILSETGSVSRSRQNGIGI
jgi:hypothetical protein